jgi:flavin reductase (DIM6/NTAB) family NADH-FMN oxidoreductase RutF
MHELASLMKYLSHGVYVIGVSDGERRNAFTAAWVMQASFDPPLLVISINPQHYSYQLLQAGGICSVNVLMRGQMQLAVHFGSPGVRDKMSIYQWTQAKTGAPILAEALAYFDCKVSHYCAAGDHRLAICEVVDTALLNNGTPLLYVETGNLDGSSELYRR